MLTLGKGLPVLGARLFRPQYDPLAGIAVRGFFEVGHVSYRPFTLIFEAP